jgi:hypothetical protein
MKQCFQPLFSPFKAKVFPAHHLLELFSLRMYPGDKAGCTRQDDQYRPNCFLHGSSLFAFLSKSGIEAAMKELASNIYYLDGLRQVPDKTGSHRPESDDEFIDRMKEASDVVWSDLERADKLLPAFDEARRANKNIREALEGIAAGGKYKEVIYAAGFAYWKEFDLATMHRAPCLKEFYDLAKRERFQRRLAEAEDALHERSVEGIDEPHLGKIVGKKKKYSDSLLALQLKALDPDKYGDRKQDPNQGLVVHVNMAGFRSGMPQAEVELEQPYQGLPEDIGRQEP